MVIDKPPYEGIAFVCRCRNGRFDVIGCLIFACAFNRTCYLAFHFYSLDLYHIRSNVTFPLRAQLDVFRQRERVGLRFTNGSTRRVVLKPTDELIVTLRVGLYRNFLIGIESTCADYFNGRYVEVIQGYHIGLDPFCLDCRILSHINAIRQSLRFSFAVDVPTVKTITAVDRCQKVCFCTDFKLGARYVLTVNLNCTGCIDVFRSSKHYFFDPFCCQSDIIFQLESIGQGGRLSHRPFVPAVEIVVVASRRSRNRYVGIQVEQTATSNRTCCRSATINGNRVGRNYPLCFQRHVFRKRINYVRLRSRNWLSFTFLKPAEEGVSFISDGFNRPLGAVIEGTCTLYTTCRRGVNAQGDLVLLYLPSCFVGCV